MTIESPTMERLMRNSRPCQDIRQALVEPAELAEDVRTAEAQIAAEHGIAHKAAQRITLARLRDRATLLSGD